MWLKPYLTARKQQFLINGCLSSQSNLLCGVPQGSILGRLLFLIYLKWKTVETRRSHTKAILMYKILNDLSAPQLSNSFVKLNQ